VLLAWLRAGMPGPDKNDPELRRLEVSPAQRPLRTGPEQQLTVRTEYSDGSRRDVTWLTKLDSNDAGVAEVDANGLARVRRHGETSVRAAFQGQVAVAVLTAPFERPVAPARL